MNKLKEHQNYKILIGLLLGILISATGVYAATIGASKDVYYNNTTSKLSSTNVQDALDEVYTKTNNRLTTYAFGTPTNSSPVDFQEVISSSGSKAFVKKQGNQLSVCSYYNNRLFCMKPGTANWNTNKAMLNTTTFPGATCGSDSSDAHCYDASFGCSAKSYGDVYCVDGKATLECYVFANGTAACKSK